MFAVEVLRVNAETEVRRQAQRVTDRVQQRLGERVAERDPRRQAPVVRSDQRSRAAETVPGTLLILPEEENAVTSAQHPVLADTIGEACPRLWPQEVAVKCLPRLAARAGVEQTAFEGQAWRLRLNRTRLIECEAPDHTVVPLHQWGLVVVAEAEVQRQARAHFP